MTGSEDKQPKLAIADPGASYAIDPHRFAVWKRALLAVLLAPAGWHIYTLVRTFASRIAFPMDFEWMESSHVYHAYRLLHGLPLYIDPARGFATFPYPPGYWFAVAALGKLTGTLDYATARGVSVLSVVGCAIVFTTLLVRRAPNRTIGIVFSIFAVASIGAGYPFAYGSFDLARPDAFASAMAVIATAVAPDAPHQTSSGDLAASPPSRKRWIATCALLIGAIYAKQTGVFFALWILLYVFVFQSRRHGIVLAAATVLGAAALLGALSFATGGWFFVWLFDMRHHGISPLSTLADPLILFLKHAPFLLVLPPLVFFLRRCSWLMDETIKWVGALAAAILGALVAHAKLGGWVNVFTPVLILAWPVFLLVVCDLLRGMLAATPTTSSNTNKNTGARAERFVLWPLLVAMSGVLVFLHYDASPFRPTEKMWRAAAHFHEVVTTLTTRDGGPGIVTTMPFVAVRDVEPNAPNIEKIASCTQPILQGYIDAKNAGMRVSFTESLEQSDAQWIIVTGTIFEEHLPAELSSHGFQLDRELTDVDLDSPGVQHPLPRTLWRRVRLPKGDHPNDHPF